jgi:hypothetical protein
MGMTPAQLLKNNTLLFDTVFGHVVRPLGANMLMAPGLLLPLLITKDPDSQALPKAIPAVLRVRSTKPDLVVTGTTNSAKVGWWGFWIRDSPSKPVPGPLRARLARWRLNASGSGLQKRSNRL